MECGGVECVEVECGVWSVWGWSVECVGVECGMCGVCRVGGWVGSLTSIDCSLPLVTLDRCNSKQ